MQYIHRTDATSPVIINTYEADTMSINASGYVHLLVQNEKGAVVVIAIFHLDPGESVVAER